MENNGMMAYIRTCAFPPWPVISIDGPPFFQGYPVTWARQMT
jgi:hypothetical protein